MNGFQFANPEMLYFMLIIPFLVVFFIYYRINRKKVLNAFGNESVVAQLMPEVSKYRPAIKFSLLMLISSFLIIALARPQFGSKKQTIQREGVEIVIALDLSNSMMATDIRPNRLRKAKNAIYKLSKNMQNDNVGIIVFAGEAFTLVPLSSDYSSIKLFLENVSTDYIRNQGTSFASAIELGMKSFSADNEKQKALILISDGENHEKDAVEMARQAKEKGIVIHTIGVGSTRGVPIPIGNGRRMKNPETGRDVITKLNEAFLQEIAQQTDGSYVRATNSNFGLAKIYDKIGEMETQEFETHSYAEYEDVFHVALWLVLALLLIEYFTLNRKNRLLERLNLFN